MIFEIAIAFSYVSADYKLAEVIANIWVCLAIATLLIVLAQGFYLSILGVNPLYILAGSILLFSAIAPILGQE